MDVRVAGGVSLREVRPDDEAWLRDVHLACFPVNYEDAFFDDAVAWRNGVFAFVAEAGPEAVAGGAERRIGVVVARVMDENVAREYAGNEPDVGRRGPAAAPVRFAYVMTLGVAEPWRGRGVAGALLRRCVAHAERVAGCAAVYLHVIEYNVAAQRLYAGNGFTCERKLPRFYTILGERAPDPNNLVHDAFMYVRYLHGARPTWGAGTLMFRLADAFTEFLAVAAACGSRPVREPVVLPVGQPATFPLTSKV